MTTAPTPPPWRRGWRPCAPNWRSAGWTVLWCRTPTQHQGEYLPANAERLAWLTSFTGSAGAAVVLKDKAAIFVDGRYTLQVRAQTDTSLFEPRDLVAEGPQGWLPDHLPQGRQAGLTIPGCTPPAWRGSVCAAAAEKAGGTLVALRHQSDRCGVERSARAAARPRPMPHALNLAGERREAKRARVAEGAEESQAPMRR